MTSNSRNAFFVTTLTILGAALRLSAPFSAAFPLNDGGLFYQMILELQGNGYKLPAYTNYNFDLIPYAYPPLAFYLYGIVNDLSGISLIILIQFLPAAISILTIPAFYFLANSILGDTHQALWSTAAFALIPRTFDWLIMGGGTTRSLGLLFAILSIHQAYLLFSSPTHRNLLPTILLSGFVVLTHPEASIHTVIAALFFYFWKDRSIKGAIRAGVVGTGVLILSAPWWLTVLLQHGSNPFLAATSAASENSYYPLTGILALFKFQFTDEPFLQIISVIGLLGFFVLSAQSKMLLPIWIILISVLEPRGGTLYIILPIAMSAGVVIEQILLPTLKSKNENSKSAAWISFITFFIVYGSINALNVAHNIEQKLSISEEDTKAFAWIEANTQPGSKFILLTQGLPLNDSTSEWFPVMAKRKSIATVFGYEWVNDGNFASRIQNYQKLQKCTVQETACLENWAHSSSFTHIYIKEKEPMLIKENLINSPNYLLIFQSEKITIFEKIP